MIAALETGLARPGDLHRPLRGVGQGLLTDLDVGAREVPDLPHFGALLPDDGAALAHGDG